MIKYSIIVRESSREQIEEIVKGYDLAFKDFKLTEDNQDITLTFKSKKKFDTFRRAFDYKRSKNND